MEGAIEMKLSFGFGKGTQEVNVPEKNLMGILTANPAQPPESEEAEIRRH